MKKHKQALLALLASSVVFVCGMAFAASISHDYFNATVYHEVLAAGSGPGLLSRAGVYFNNEVNTFRTFGASDSFNMGESGDIFNLSGGSDVLAFGGSGFGNPGEGDIITFDIDGGALATAYTASRSYIKGSGMSQYLIPAIENPELEVRSRVVKISSNGDGDVVIVLGR